MQPEIFYGNVPEPLSENELQEYFKRYKNGDKDSRNIIINHNIRLVLKLVSTKYSSAPYPKDELFHVGMLELIKCIDTFDIDKNVKFSTYVSRCINNALINYIRYQDRRNIPICSFDKSADPMDENGSPLKNSLSEAVDIQEEYEIKERNEKIKEIINQLDEREKMITLLYFGFIDGERWTQGEIGKMYNVSGSNIGFIIKKVLLKIKNELIINGFEYSEKTTKCV